MKNFLVIVMRGDDDMPDLIDVKAENGSEAIDKAVSYYIEDEKTFRKEMGEDDWDADQDWFKRHFAVAGVREVVV